jgi:Na+-driven multidrug efflux pump
MYIARPLASLFLKDPSVIEVAVLYFRIVPVAYGLQGYSVL